MESRMLKIRSVYGQKEKQKHVKRKYFIGQKGENVKSEGENVQLTVTLKWDLIKQRVKI